MSRNQAAPTGTMAAMCMTTIDTLTFTAMLRDPLIQMMRRSDGVSDDDFADLLHRVRDRMIEREPERFGISAMVAA